MDIVENDKHKSKILASAKIERVTFDPKKKTHRESLKKFIETGLWGNVRFKHEFPHVEVPMTCLMKLARHHLNVK